jgi:hypothetical protein
MHFVCVELHVTVNSTTVLSAAHGAFMANLCRRQRCNVLRSRVKCPILVCCCSQIWSFSTEFRESPQYKISEKSVQWLPR